MDIVSRLKLFLNQNGIPNSQFADTCDIPRPTLSQLLNGRNKKVSDEIITKIHNAYPQLNIMWLMFGDGNMFVPNANNGNTSSIAQPRENGKIQSAHASGRENTNGAQQQSISFGDDDESDYPATAEPPAMAPSSLQAALANIARSAGRSNTVNASKVTNGRRIVNILVFYNDNSFESFTPTAGNKI